ncbi:MAG: hypothetical protein JNL11_09895 [Bdellovibrionaceae bacterium]|nr:hypothetical protein [Pseudobdellovibrionaceae bacterium]
MIRARVISKLKLFCLFEAMTRGWLKSAAVCLILIFPNLAISSNSHEHFASLFLAENFAAVGDEVFTVPRDVQLLTHTIGTYERYLMILKVNFGYSQEEARKLISEAEFSDLTISDLCRRLPGAPMDNFKKLISFSIGTSNIQSMVLRKIYATIETMRLGWIKSFSNQALEKMYRNYFETDHRENWDEIHLSIPKSFAIGEHQNQYSQFLQIAKEHGAQIKTYISVVRSYLNKASDHFMSAPHTDGVDITSSIFEDEEHSDTKKTKYFTFEILKHLLDQVSQSGKELRIHAFEASNRGPFYHLLMQVLAKYDKPIRIRIGHINHINKQWLELFSSNTNLKIRFDVNVASNITLHSANVHEIIEKMKLIHSFGYSTDLGSDGRGILPGTSYRAQLKLLNTNGLQYKCLKYYVP